MKSDFRTLATLSLAFALAFAGCSLARHPGTAHSFGDDALTVDTSPSVVATARDAVVHKYQHWVKDAQGRNYDPSMKQSSRSWKTSPPASRQTFELTRSLTEFRDENGQTIKIEIISSAGQPSLVFFTHDLAPSLGDVCGEFVRSLQSQGVQMR